MTIEGAEALVRDLISQAIRERLWLVALFFIFTRKNAVKAAVASRDGQHTPREKSPFVYNMR